MEPKDPLLYSVNQSASDVTPLEKKPRAIGTFPYRFAIIHR